MWEAAQGDASELIIASNLEPKFPGVRLRRIADHGRIHRVWRGHYIESSIWASKTPRERHATVALAAASSRDRSAVMSHLSAAAFWGLPLLVRWPDIVHFTVDRATGGRSSPGVRVHATGIDSRDVVEHQGVLVTSLPRTVIDNAASVDVKSAVAMVDRALWLGPRGRGAPMTTKRELTEILERSLPVRGSTRARGAIEFGTHLSGSPAESASRVNMAIGGFPEPELQRHWSIDGSDYESDFYWLGFDGIGECDGKEKYFSPAMRGRKTPEEVLWAEKLREDALRREVAHFIRWDFATAMNLARLSHRLVSAGLRPGRPRAIR